MGIMAGFVMQMFYNEFICIYFQLHNSYAFSLRISCMYLATNYNYPTAIFFFFCSIGFHKFLIKLFLYYY